MNQADPLGVNPISHRYFYEKSKATPNPFQQIKKGLNDKTEKVR